MRTRTRSISTTAAALLVTATTLASAGAASAAETDSGPQGTSLLDVLTVHDVDAAPVQAASRAAYDALTPAQQAEFDAVLASEDPASQPGVTTSYSESTAKTVALGVLKPAGVSPNITVYNVTYTWTATTRFLGVPVGYFKQVFKYQTGNNVVLTTQYCNASFEGFSGPWAMSVSNTHYVASGQGHCISDFTLSAVYKGSNISMQKQMWVITNGPGLVDRDLTVG
ncbi:hypothetical protein [Cellulomonas sp.]|uniref:hypothetical protein n=1 Tax=Cellulomonas sp. TaxID=40001 RepID=UPI001B040E73|nr:hypothetical protein [Cellulomonas sp.]MBO9556461.1 hypothetical protein [Cellulomonas sp.]